MMIYFDNAATTLKKPDEVISAVVNALQTMGNSGRGVHDAALDASRVIFDTRIQLAEFFNAESPKQIVFTMNSTESLNIAIKGILESGDHVITTEMEHNSVLRPLLFAGIIESSTPFSSISYKGRNTELCSISVVIT